MAMAELQPIRLLIAALGGEGGGVLAGWISEAAAASGLVVSRTSIPGVAQRTGATTYYIETVRASGSAVPILGLNPAPGQVDILLATELLEAARMVHAGFVTPARTLVVAADRRVYATDEKVAMADGRASEGQLCGTLERFSKRLVLTDLAAVAADSRSPLNVVILGVLAGLKVLPIEADTFRSTIRAEGKAVEANLRGFEAGLLLAQRVAAAPSPRHAGGLSSTRQGEGHGGAVPPARGEGQPRTPAQASAPHPNPLPTEEWGEGTGFPAEAQAVLREGVARLADYQNEAYASRYLARVRRIANHPRADGDLVRELARHLAIRMSVEDVIRVAQLKLRDSRLARVTREAQARQGDIVDITEYMKPGPEEVLGLLPPRLGRWALARVRHDRSWPLKVRTTRFSGFLRLKLLAGLKFWRPRTLRFAEEEAWIERWLALVEQTLAVDQAAAREVVAAAALVRGYADTYKRGLANWTRIMEAVVGVGLSGALPRAQFADAILQARLAAVKDPEGEALAKTIAAIRNAAGPKKLAAE
jgi:indolepyruvate ferredoxin oxidoreductase beta subunit